MARKALSKKARFEVFKRDGFICQYCGSHPPTVVLHVDHIVPVAGGGTNDQDNLITSCLSCNLGKGARSLDDIPQSLRDKAKEIEEKEAQIIGYNNVLKARANRIENDSWDVVAALENVQRAERYYTADLQSIKKFLTLLPTQEVIDAAHIAFAAKPYKSKYRFKYFCGVCWAKVREANNA